MSRSNLAKKLKIAAGSTSCSSSLTNMMTSKLPYIASPLLAKMMMELGGSTFTSMVTFLPGPYTSAISGKICYKELVLSYKGEPLGSSVIK